MCLKHMTAAAKTPFVMRETAATAQSADFPCSEEFAAKRITIMRISTISLSVIMLTIISSLPALADDFKRIKTPAEFNEMVVDKKLVWGGGTATVRANGKTDGTLKKQGKYYGNWVFQKGFYCRNLIIQKKETGTNCQLVEINGNKVRFTRNQGKGHVTLLSIE